MGTRISSLASMDLGPVSMDADLGIGDPGTGTTMVLGPASMDLT